MTEDNLLVIDRNRQPTDALRNMLAGASAFIVCGGPSANELPLELLGLRGIWSIGVNNVAGHVRTNAFVCSDPPTKFHDGIWLDPTVMKLIPGPKLTHKHRGYLRQKIGDTFQLRKMADGQIESTIHMPNVWGFERCPWWAYDDTFFTNPGAMWGNGRAGEIRTGNPRTFCSMLLAIRLLHYLGSRRMFLVGADFFMEEKKGYSFAQGRTQAAASNNNDQFAIVNAGLCAMRDNGVFQRAGVEIFNCCKVSGLRAFPHVDFTKAIKASLSNFPKTPFDLTHWYEKG